MPNPSAGKAVTLLAMGALGAFVLSVPPVVSASTRGPEDARVRADTPAKERHLLLVGAPVELYRAFVASLGPWNIRITTREARESLSAATESQRTKLAASESADAVAWIEMERTGGASLWLFVGGKQVAGPRPIARPPYSDIEAAAIALSVKTLLRNSVLAPPPPQAPPYAPFGLPARLDKCQARARSSRAPCRAPCR